MCVCGCLCRRSFHTHTHTHSKTHTHTFLALRALQCNCRVCVSLCLSLSLSAFISLILVLFRIVFSVIDHERRDDHESSLFSLSLSLSASLFAPSLYVSHFLIRKLSRVLILCSSPSPHKYLNETDQPKNHDNNISDVKTNKPTKKKERKKHEHTSARQFVRISPLPTHTPTRTHPAPPPIFI